MPKVIMSIFGRWGGVLMVAFDRQCMICYLCSIVLCSLSGTVIKW